MATTTRARGQPSEPTMATIALRNADILRIVMGYSPDKRFVFLAMVSRGWREAWGQRPTVTSIIPTLETSVSQLRHSFECGAPRRSTRVCTAIARLGRLDILRYAREHHCPWDARTCAAAALQAPFQFLEYLTLNSCPWDASTCEAAADRGSWPESTTVPGTRG